MRKLNNAQCLVVFCALFLCARPAEAHDPALSGIRILYRPDDVLISVTTHISRLQLNEHHTSMPMTPNELDAAVRRRLHVKLAGKNVLPGEAHVIADKTNDLLSWQTLLSKYDDSKCEVLAPIYPEDPSSRTIVDIVRNGQSVQNVLLDPAHPDFHSSESSPDVFAGVHRYIVEGILHILGGADHILFVLGLLLLGGTLKSLLRIITAFTLAHSVTLTLAATGTFAPSPRFVEPLIALSIVAIAIENLREQKIRAALADTTVAKASKPSSSNPNTSAPKKIATQDYRQYVALIFGLVHGFGFAGALAEVGLPQAALGVALLSFNIGVEIGQAAIIFAVAPLLTFIAVQRPKISRAMSRWGSITIGLIGCYWFIARVLTCL